MRECKGQIARLREGGLWTHYVGNRSNLKAVERARISHSDDVTSSNALLSQWPRGFWESSIFSEVTTMDRRKPLGGLQRAGNGDASGGNN